MVYLKINRLFRIRCIMLILGNLKTMRKELREIFIHGCNEKIEKK